MATSYIELHFRICAPLDKPTLALASLRREILRMGAIVETMKRPVMELYHLYLSAFHLRNRIRREKFISPINKAIFVVYPYCHKFALRYLYSVEWQNYLLFVHSLSKFYKKGWTII